MSAISSSLSGTSALSTSGSGIASQFSQLTSEDFVKIMMTELTSQDPLKPNDSNALLQQFSSLRNIESSLALQNKLTDVVSQNQLSTAGSLLGKYVQGYTDNFDPVEGTVKSISQTSSGPVLNLASGARIPFKNIANILDHSVPTTTGPTGIIPNTGNTGTTGSNIPRPTGQNGNGNTIPLP